MAATFFENSGTGLRQPLVPTSWQQCVNSINVLPVWSLLYVSSATLFVASASAACTEKWLVQTPH